ncbi:hypothetical protein, variant [Aphanomyces invadans]|uniref:Alpha-galactosidase n=2 Tax=Aphanomyces invadans TaxID=157072 RepID=A0A024TFY7_9STRA|nr:hypothetical protein, variant [Aphanomyces invadans]ETV93085.1 hypothetical protein, variant [Aphanomyces invadans]|eukprot:XP_008878349.1 hypothetical protein, variant [Aphanomyces invadans]
MDTFHPVTTMGWWSTTFGCADGCSATDSCASENLYRTVVDHLVADGYVQAGYTWLYVEDCWMSRSRDSFGRLVPNVTTFPNGLESITAYAHARGIRVAASLDLGAQTCAGLPGSFGHYGLDVVTLANWNVDRVLLTTCSVANTTSSTTPLSLYALLSTLTSLASAVNLTSHCVVPSTTNLTLLHAVSGHCQHVQLNPRVEDDYTDVVRHVEAALHELNDSTTSPFYNASFGPIVAGGYGLTRGQARIQLTAWYLLRFPLLVAGDVCTSTTVRSSVLNSYFVKLYTAALTATSRPPRWTGVAVPGVDVWLSWIDKSVVISAFRLHNEAPHVPETLEMGWDDLGLDPAAVCTVTRVWSANVTVNQKHRFTLTIPPYDAALVVVEPQ